MYNLHDSNSPVSNFEFNYQPERFQHCVGFYYVFCVINNDRKLSTAHLTTDFIWQRASDIAAFISLFLILMNNKTIVLYKLVDQAATSPSPYAPLFFGAMILRIVTIPASNNYIKFSTDNGFNYFVLGRIFSSLGALLFLYKINKIIFDPSKLIVYI